MLFRDSSHSLEFYERKSNRRRSWKMRLFVVSPRLLSTFEVTFAASSNSYSFRHQTGGAAVRCIQSLQKKQKRNSVAVRLESIARPFSCTMPTHSRADQGRLALLDSLRQVFAERTLSRGFRSCGKVRRTRSAFVCLENIFPRSEPSMMRNMFVNIIMSS